MKEEMGRLGINDEYCQDEDEFRNRVNEIDVLMGERILQHRFKQQHLF